MGSKLKYNPFQGCIKTYQIMKQKLIALLKTLFASKGFNAKELESLADLVIGQHTLTDDSTDQDLNAAANAAKPTADFVQSVASRQVTDAKKPKPVENPTPKTEDEPKPEDDKDVPAWAKALAKSVETIGQGLQTLQSEKVGNTRRDLYAKTLEGTSDVFKAKALKDFDRMTFKDDEDFNSYLAEATEDAKGFIQDEANNGLGNDRPAGGAGGSNSGTKREATEAEVDAAFANLRI